MSDDYDSGYDRYEESQEDEVCPNCGRELSQSNPMVSNLRCRECASMQALMGEIWLFDGKNPASTILGWLLGK
jgi:hypothetical protein